MSVHAGHVRTARGTQAYVEGGGGAPGGVVEQPDAVVPLRDPGNGVRAPIGRAPVDHQDLELAVELLLTHRRERALQEPRLVEDRDEDGRATLRSCSCVRAFITSNAHAGGVCQRRAARSCLRGPYASAACVHPRLVALLG